MADDRIIVYAKLLSGDLIPLRVSPSEPVVSLKLQLEQERPDLDPLYMKLFDEEGSLLDDSDLIGMGRELVNVFVDLDTDRDVRKERKILLEYTRKKEEERLLQHRRDRFLRERKEYELAEQIRRKEADRRWREEQLAVAAARREREETEKKRLKTDEEYRIKKEREIEDAGIQFRHEQEDRMNRAKYFQIKDPVEREKFVSDNLKTRRWEMNTLKAKRAAEDIYRRAKRLLFPYRPPEEEDDTRRKSICDTIKCSLYSGKRMLNQ